MAFAMTLVCVVEGESPGSLFLIDIDSQEPVLKLRERIVSKNKNLFANLGVDQTQLNIWKLNNPISLDTVSLQPVPDNLSGHAIELLLHCKLSTYFKDPPAKGYLHLIIQKPTGREVKLYTDQWIALKHSAQFYTSSGSISSTPVAGDVLRTHDSQALLSIFDLEDVFAVFIRKCYLTWFDIFLKAAINQPRGKFALTSSPGCGKTTATNFIFKMATSEPFLRERAILYQFGVDFYHFKSDSVYDVDRNTAKAIARLPETFYIIDGLNADPVPTNCLTIFISSPRSNIFKSWHYHLKVTPLYFPVWTLEELYECRTSCYPDISQEVVDNRYERYGGIARYVFWTKDNDPPSIEGIVSDTNARKGILSVGEPSQVFPTSHMLLHISVDEVTLQFQHIVLASRHVGRLLFCQYFEETFERLKSLLGARGAISGHLFESYVHFLFENGNEVPLVCQSLEGDKKHLVISFPQRTVEVFSAVPEKLAADKYYVPLSANFPAIDGLIQDAALQYTVTDNHPVKGVGVLKKLASLFPKETLNLVFIVPQSIAADFPKQRILTNSGEEPANMPAVRQFVAGFSLGIDT